MSDPTTTDLLHAHCKPCSEGDAPLSKTDAEQRLEQLDTEWVISEDGKSISRSFKFKNYYETMAFVNAAALVSHQQDHHPDLRIGYNTCHIEYSTHSIGGLSDNDFICAAKTDGLLAI